MYLNGRKMRLKNVTSKCRRLTIILSPIIHKRIIIHLKIRSPKQKYSSLKKLTVRQKTLKKMSLAPKLFKLKLKKTPCKHKLNHLRLKHKLKLPILKKKLIVKLMRSQSKRRPISK